MRTKHEPVARSLQEWMERHRTNSLQLLALVRAKTGRTISPTLFSYILRGARRCSLVNALALNAVTGVDTKTLTEWPKVSTEAQLLGRRPKRVA